MAFCSHSIYIFRFNAGLSNSFTFNSYFLTMLLNDSKKEDCKYWTIKRDIKIFTKKMLLFPFCSANHWSLYVVINPGCIQSGYQGRERKRTVPFILHLDSLGGNSPHRKSYIDHTLRWWLNRVWQEESSNEYDN